MARRRPWGVGVRALLLTGVLAGGARVGSATQRVCTHMPATWSPPPLSGPPPPSPPPANGDTSGEGVTLSWIEGRWVSEGGGSAWRQLVRSEIVPPQPITPLRNASRLRCATAAPTADCDVKVTHALLINDTAFEVHFSLPTTMLPPSGPGFNEVPMVVGSGDDGSSGWLVVKGHECASLAGQWIHPAVLVVACHLATRSSVGDGDDAAGVEAAKPPLAASVVVLADGAVWDTQAVAAAHAAAAAAVAGGTTPAPVTLHADTPGSMTLRRCTWRVPLVAWGRQHERCAAALQGGPGAAADAFRTSCSTTSAAGGAECTDGDDDGSVVVFRDCTRDAPPDAIHIVPPSLRDEATAGTAAAAAVVPTPAVHFAGVLSSGTFAAGIVPDATMPHGARNGTGWSMCMWLWLVEGARDCADGMPRDAVDGSCPPGAAGGGGGYRSLFFKGAGGNDQHRTPSAWLEPDSDFLTLRVSQSAPVVEYDVSARTATELPARAWTHLCFTFDNHTWSHGSAGGSGGGSGGFAVAIYLNGTRDVVHLWQAPVTISRNSAPLRFGASHGFAGARALLSQVALYDGVLDGDAVRALFDHDAPTYGAAPHDSDTTPDGSAAWALLRWGVVRATSALTAAATGTIPPPGGLPAVTALFDGSGTDGGGMQLLPPSAAVVGKAIAAAGDVSGAAAAALAALRGCRTSMGMPPPPPPSAANTCTPGPDGDVCDAAATSAQPSEYDAMVGMLVAAEGAALDGRGARAAAALVADWLAYPGRDGCDAWHADAAALTAARDATSPWWHAASLNVRSAWGALMGAHASLPAAFEAASGATWGRAADRAAVLRARAAARRDGTALYDLGVSLLTRTLSLPGGRLPSLADDAIAIGYLHVATTGGETYALHLLARLYGKHGLRGLPTSLTPPPPPATDDSSTCSDALRRNLLAAADTEVAEWAAFEAGGCGHPGAPIDGRTAAAYWDAAASAAMTYFERPAGQPAHEFVRLTPATADTGGVEEGQRGEGDNRHQLTLERAERGEVDAMVAAGNLYYWGGGGMAVDRAAAYRWWNAAADAGNAGAAAAAGGMAVMGQGVPRDIERGLALYRQAAAANDTRALNGLGYAYFQGAEGLPPNATLACEYFARAAALQNDADSLLNAAYCLSTGVGGTTANMSAAVAHWVLAAERFASFRGGLDAGRAYLAGWQSPVCTPRAAAGAADAGAVVVVNGKSVEDDTVSSAHDTTNACEMVATPPDVNRAIALLAAAVNATGPWADLSRRGFRRYLARDYPGALGRFLEAALHGYTTGAANAGYLLLRHLAALPLPPPAGVAAGLSLFRTCLDAGEVDVAVSAADYALAEAGYGMALPLQSVDERRLADSDAAAVAAVAGAWYALACTAEGSAHGCYSLAAMLEAGIGGRRVDAAAATLYYERALAAAPTGVLAAPAKIALTRLRTAAWLQDALALPWVHAAVDAGSLVAVAAARAGDRLLNALSTRAALGGLASLYIALLLLRAARRRAGAAVAARRAAAPPPTDDAAPGDAPGDAPVAPVDAAQQ